MARGQLWPEIYLDSKFHRGQHWAHLGPVGPKWAPCWPHEPCYQGMRQGTHAFTYASTEWKSPKHSFAGMLYGRFRINASAIFWYILGRKVHHPHSFLCLRKHFRIFMKYTIVVISNNMYSNNVYSKSLLWLDKREERKMTFTSDC